MKTKKKSATKKLSKNRLLCVTLPETLLASTRAYRKKSGFSSMSELLRATIDHASAVALKKGAAESKTQISFRLSDELYTSLFRASNQSGQSIARIIRTLLESKGISCEGKRAQVLKREHGDKFDLFLCMDDNNVRNASRILGEKNAAKCKKLLSYAGESGDVADPWYTRNFEIAYEDVKRGLEGLLKELQ